MTHLYRIVFIALLILLIVGIIGTTMTVLSMGDDTNSGQLRFNQIINYAVGFPIVVFKNGFPLLLSNKEFWSFTNVALMILNSILQASGLYILIKWIRR